MQYDSSCRDCNSFRSSSNSNLTYVDASSCKWGRRHYRRKSLDQKFLAPCSWDVFIHTLNIEFLSWIFHRCFMLTSRFRSTGRTVTIFSLSHYSGIHHDATHQSAQLVSFGFEIRIQAGRFGVGADVSVCLEGMGYLDAVSMVVYMVACMVIWSRRSDCSSLRFTFVALDDCSTVAIDESC
jgi:hypothetical protein